MSQELQLLRVVARGPELPNTIEHLEGVEYRREPSDKTGIYLTFRLPKRLSGLHGLVRNDEGMKVTALKLPFSRSVGVEFCGTEIDELVQAAGVAESNTAAIDALQPLLVQVQATFKAT